MNILLWASGDVSAVGGANIYIVPICALICNALVTDKRPAAVSAKNQAAQDIRGRAKMVMLAKVRIIAFACLLRQIGRASCRERVLRLV